jgi:cytochrome P450
MSGSGVGRALWRNGLRGARLFALLWLLVRVVKAWRWLREVRRAHALLCRLPALSSPGDSAVFGFAGSAEFLKGRPFTLQGITSALPAALREVLQSNAELRRCGVANLWMLNGALCRAVPNTANVVIVFGMSKVRKILATKSQSQLVKGNSYVVSFPLIGHGVLASSGEEWAHQRHVLDRGFKDDVMAASVPDVTAVVQRMVDKWAGLAARGEAINTFEECLKMTMDVLGWFAFSHDFGSVTAATTADAPLYDAFNTILAVLNARCMLPPLAATAHIQALPTNWAFNKAMAKLSGIIDEMIAARRMGKSCARRSSIIVGGTRAEEDAQGEDAATPRDLLDVMLDQSGDGKAMTAKQLRDNIQTQLFAGHDTTGAALTWFLLMLSREPAIVARLRAEYAAVLGGAEAWRNPSFEQIDQLELLNACLLETLRLYPSAGFTRNTVEDFELEGYVIPKNTELLILPYLTQRDPDYFERPNEFWPDRWLTDPRLKSTSAKVSLKSHLSVVGLSAQYLPFSLGQRSCVGKILAVNELRIAVVKLLQRFDFEQVPCRDFQEEPQLLMTLNPRGVFLKATLRS